MMVYLVYTKLKCYGFGDVVSNGYVWPWFQTVSFLYSSQISHWSICWREKYYFLNTSFLYIVTLFLMMYFYCMERFVHKEERKNHNGKVTHYSSSQIISDQYYFSIPPENIRKPKVFYFQVV